MWKKLRKHRNMTQLRRRKKDRGRFSWMNSINYRHEMKNFIENERSFRNKYKNWFMVDELDYFLKICCFGQLKDGNCDEHMYLCSRSKISHFDRILIIRLQTELNQILKLKKTLHW